ncbi:MAG TPA: hypothetical protein VGG06_21030 [Thermoanaerobaculia bacterium]|jgi:predicted  nucleic acid-binding Zn-ribbon protein
MSDAILAKLDDLKGGLDALRTDVAGLCQAVTGLQNGQTGLQNGQDALLRDVVEIKNRLEEAYRDLLRAISESNEVVLESMTSLRYRVTVLERRQAG